MRTYFNNTLSEIAMLKALLVMVLLTMTQHTPAEDSNTPTLDDLVKEWYIVNDTVMGGLSQADLYWDNEEKAFLFTGKVSLRNNGGFASVRGVFPDSMFSKAEKICIMVKGDGQDYQLRLRANRNMDGVAYVQSFSTKKSEWQEIELPLKDFKPTWRGREVPGYKALKTDEIKQISFMIADKQSGPFEFYFKEVKPCDKSQEKDYI